MLLPAIGVQTLMLCINTLFTAIHSISAHSDSPYINNMTLSYGILTMILHTLNSNTVT